MDHQHNTHTLSHRICCRPCTAASASASAWQLAWRQLARQPVVYMLVDKNLHAKHNATRSQLQFKHTMRACLAAAVVVAG